MEKNKVFIVIPVHNRLQLTKSCLKSLSQQTYKNFEVIVVDGGSQDQTKNFVRNKYPNFKIIEGTSRWWWTRCMYEGVNYSLQFAQKGDFILSLNNDCFSRNSYLKNIVSASKKNKRAITGSLVVDASNHSRVVESGIKIDWHNGVIYGVSESTSDKRSFYKNKVVNNIDTLPGKGTLIPIEVFSKVSNFSFRLLPHYISDYEFFCRTKRKKFNLIVSPQAVLYNFTETTGIIQIYKNKFWIFSVAQALFSRRSKINIIDQLIFTIRICPSKYLARNLWFIFLKFVNHAFPFYYKFKLFLHNAPIYIRQNTTTKRVIKFLKKIFK